MNKKFSMMAAVALVVFTAWMSYGAALSEDRNTPQRDGDVVSVAVASGKVVYAGAMIAVNSSGTAQPASDASGLSVIGRAENYVDASVTAGLLLKVSRGVFLWENGSSITDADIGDLCYALDDQTVKTTGVTNYVIAGVIVDVDDNGVWVDTYSIGSQGAGSLSSLSVSGAGTIAGAFSAVGRKTLLTKDSSTQYVVETGTATNGQVVAYTTAFSAVPAVFLDYVTHVSTNSKAGATSVNPTNFTANGTAALQLNWMAIGAK